MILKGAGHVHSNYSYDGRCSLTEIARLFQERGAQFVLIADHAEKGMTADRYVELVRECAALSSETFLMVPGLEIETTEGYHVLGYGMRAYDRSDDLVDAADRIRKQGGLAALAHPIWQECRYDERFARLDGIEVMNSKYDGKWSPRLRAVSLYRRLLRANPALTFTSGPDFHKPLDLENPSYLYVDIDRLDRDAILAALRDRAHAIGNGSLRYRPHLFGPFSQLAMIHSEYVYLPVRKYFRLAKAYALEAWKQIVVERNFSHAFRKIAEVIARPFGVGK